MLCAACTLLDDFYSLGLFLLLFFVCFSFCIFLALVYEKQLLQLYVKARLFLSIKFTTIFKKD